MLEESKLVKLMRNSSSTQCRFACRGMVNRCDAYSYGQ
jgi:hypothetical protein